MVRVKRTRSGRYGLYHSTTGAPIKRRGRQVTHATKKAALKDARATRRRNR
jgi:hypothetical protein